MTTAEKVGLYRPTEEDLTAQEFFGSYFGSLTGHAKLAVLEIMRLRQKYEPSVDEAP